MYSFFLFEIHNEKKLMINIVEKYNIIIEQVIHNNRFDINYVVTIFWVLSTGQDDTLDISLGGYFFTALEHWGGITVTPGLFFLFLLKNIIKVKTFSMDFHYRCI